MPIGAVDLDMSPSTGNLSRLIGAGPMLWGIDGFEKIITTGDAGDLRLIISPGLLYNMASKVFGVPGFSSQF